MEVCLCLNNSCILTVCILSKDLNDFTKMYLSYLVASSKRMMKNFKKTDFYCSKYLRKY